MCVVWLWSTGSECDCRRRRPKCEWVMMKMCEGTLADAADARHRAKGCTLRHERHTSWENLNAALPLPYVCAKVKLDSNRFSSLAVLFYGTSACCNLSVGCSQWHCTSNLVSLASPVRLCVSCYSHHCSRHLPVWNKETIFVNEAADTFSPWGDPVSPSQSQARGWQTELGTTRTSFQFVLFLSLTI